MVVLEMSGRITFSMVASLLLQHVLPRMGTSWREVQPE